MSLTYDLAAPELKSWGIPPTVLSAPASSETEKLAQLLKDVPAVLIETAPFPFEVQDLNKHMLAEAIVHHFDDDDETFVRRDLQQGKWEVTDIRLAEYYVSCIVQFAQGYAVPKGYGPPEGSDPNGWPAPFGAGRYVFTLDDGWRSEPEKVELAKHNIASAAYEVHPPRRAP